MRVRAVCATCVCVCAAAYARGATAQGTAHSATPEQRRAVSARREDSTLVRLAPIAIDGRLDDAAWRMAGLASGFVQQRPTPGARSTQPAEARVWLDGGALYVGMRLHDAAPDSIAAPLARRDADVYSDWALVLIDSYNDRRTAFQFAVNPRGVQRDAQITNDQEWQQDYGWNAVWQVETARDSLGWTAEFRIPLSQLRFSGSAGESRWGIQFGRHLARANERSYWAPVLPDRTGFVSQFGLLTDIALGLTSRRFELVPYTLAQMTARAVDAADPLARAREPRATLGADLKWDLTPDFALTATLNPDFGQVESDPSEVNLTALETFFREQRPFFLEGAELFSFPMSAGGWVFGPQELFYSRRIGRAPQVANPSDTHYANRPGATDLLGAVKVTGKTAGGWSLGVLGALTDEMRAAVSFRNGRRDQVVVEPLTRYAMGRLQRDFAGGESVIGAVATSVLRDDSAPELRRSAFVSGVDFRHRFGGRRYQIAGHVLGSTVSGTREAMIATQRSSVHYFQRPDAHHLDVDSARSELSGVVSELRMSKVGGALRWGGAAQVMTSGFEANDLGFHSRSDLLSSTGWIGRSWFDGPRGIRNWEAWLNVWGGWTLGGEREKVGQSVWARAELENFWNVEGTIEHHVPGLSVPALRGGPALYTPRKLSGYVRLTSDARRSTVAQFMATGARELGESGSLMQLEPQVTQRVAERAQIVVSPSLTWWRNPQQFVERVGTRYVVGDVKQTTAALTTRLDLSFTPRLSLQLYAQPFLSSATYRRFGEVADAHASAARNRVTRFEPNPLSFATDGRVGVQRGGNAYDFEDPDFGLNELRTNSVLRWEYRPGSTLFLVWSHGRTGEVESGAFDLRRQTRELSETRGDHVFLLKLSHWLGR